MKPQHYIKKEIIRQYADDKGVEFKLDSPEEIEKVYEELDQNDYICDIAQDFRGGQIETDIIPDWSRYYESKSVAAEIDGKWIGWTYWYGGGKHGQPEAIDWMGYAYFLQCIGEETIVIKKFKKI